MSEIEGHKLSGGYYSPLSGELINLNAASELWLTGDCASEDSCKLNYKSCGEDYHTYKSTGEVTQLFNKLANDGLFIPVKDKLINTKSIQSVWYDEEKSELAIYKGGDAEYIKMDREMADHILDELCKQRRFQRVKDYAVNMNKAINMWFEHGIRSMFEGDKMRVLFLGGHSIYINMDKNTYEEFKDEAQQRPQFKDIAGEIINLSLAGNVWADGKDIRIGYPGSNVYITAGRDAMRQALQHFGPEQGYLRLADELLNPNLLTSASSKKGGFFSRPKLTFQIASSGYYIKGETPKIDALLAELEQRDDYIRIDDQRININSISLAYYHGNKFHYAQGADEHSVKMPYDEAKQLLDKINKQSQFLNIDGKIISAQFATSFKFYDDALNIEIGTNSHRFEMSKEKAYEMIEKVENYGIERAEKINELRKMGADKLLQSGAFDPDFSAELYEEIDDYHVNNTALFAATNAAITTTILINN